LDTLIPNNTLINKFLISWYQIAVVIFNSTRKSNTPYATHSLNDHLVAAQKF